MTICILSNLATPIKLTENSLSMNLWQSKSNRNLESIFQQQKNAVLSKNSRNLEKIPERKLIGLLRYLILKKHRKKNQNQNKKHQPNKKARPNHIQHQQTQNPPVYQKARSHSRKRKYTCFKKINVPVHMRRQRRKRQKRKFKRRPRKRIKKNFNRIKTFICSKGRKRKRHMIGTSQPFVMTKRRNRPKILNNPVPLQSHSPVYHENQNQTEYKAQHDSRYSNQEQSDFESFEKEQYTSNNLPQNNSGFGHSETSFGHSGNENRRAQSLDDQSQNDFVQPQSLIDGNQSFPNLERIGFAEKRKKISSKKGFFNYVAKRMRMLGVTLKELKYELKNRRVA